MCRLITRVECLNTVHVCLWRNECFMDISCKVGVFFAKIVVYCLCKAVRFLHCRLSGCDDTYAC